jgi:hypothetical protein
MNFEKYIKIDLPAYSQFNPDAARLQIIKRVEALLRDRVALLDVAVETTS